MFNWFYEFRQNESFIIKCLIDFTNSDEMEVQQNVLLILEIQNKWMRVYIRHLIDFSNSVKKKFWSSVYIFLILCINK